MPDLRAFQHGVATSWSFNIQTTVAADSTDAGTKAMFQVSKKSCALKNFLTSTNLDPIINTLPHIYTDNRATIRLIKPNKLTYRSRHLDVPIAFTHERYALGFYTIDHIPSKLNAADTSTKTTEILVLVFQ